MTTVQTPQKTSRRDIHQQVTDTIIQQLEAGTVPWHKPWKQGGSTNRNKNFTPNYTLPRNFTTGNRYKGVNILLLWGSADKQQFGSNQWASFKQWQAKEEAVRKGEKGTMIVYYDTIIREIDGEEKKIPFIKSSVVFNREQLASFEQQEGEPETPIPNLVERVEHVHEFIENTKAVIEHIEPRAYYSRTFDKINMPPPELFVGTPTCTPTEAYYSTLLHELTHWSGSPQRLDRTKGKRFGDDKYAAEELVAELGAAFLCAELQITLEEKGDHAAYIDHWLKVLKEDKHCLFTAASGASKAVDYLQGLQPTG